MKRSKAEDAAYKKGRSDQPTGRYDNPSDPLGFGILKSNDQGEYHAYREGWADKERENNDR